MPESKPGDSPAAALARRIPALIAAFRAEMRGAGSRGSELRGDGTARAATAAPGAALADSEIASVGAALLRLQRGLTGERVLAGGSDGTAPRYMDEPALLGAYILYYWPVSYMQVALALAELGIAPRRILDLGSGPGPAAAAAYDAAKGRGGAERLVLADRSRAALGLARRALGSEGGASFGYRELDLEAEGAALGEERFDLVLIGHCLNELWPERADRAARRLALVESAAALLEPGGALLAVEPALLATSREALALRDALAANGYPILGPCPGSYPCPALAAGTGRTCHAEAAWDPPEPVASLARAAGLDRRSVKSTWFAIGSPGGAAGSPGGAACSPSGAAAPQSAAAPPPAAAADGISVSRNAFVGRVVSDPMLNKAGRVRYLLCAESSLAAISAARDSAEARGSGFLDLRRGDMVRVEDAEPRPGGGLGIAARTRLERLSRSGSPGGEGA